MKENAKKNFFYFIWYFYKWLCKVHLQKPLQIVINFRGIVFQNEKIYIVVLECLKCRDF
jgi:hypothetical protein